MSVENDGNVNIGVNIDSEGADKGLKSLKDKVSSIGNNSVVKGVANLGLAFTGVASAVKPVINVMKKANAEIQECAKLYNVQVRAEKQLESAAKNNPYLNGESVARLKTFAGELQQIGTIGDESLMPLMAQLASAGRTQAEIQAIMSASLDVSASGAMSLESAVRNLNKTYAGLSGELGESIPQIKNLTAEELKQGKAVEVVAEQYKGMAAEVTKASGSREQLANAMGDFKEELGAPFEKAMSPLRQFFAELVGGWASALSAKRKYKEAQALESAGNETVESLTAQLDEAKKQLEKAVNDKRNGMSVERAQQVVQGNYTGGYMYNAQAIVAYSEEVDRLQGKIDKLNKAESENQKAAEKESLVKSARNAVEAYNQAIEAKEKEIELRKQAGEQIAQEDEAAEQYQARFAALLELIGNMPDKTLWTEIERQMKKADISIDTEKAKLVSLAEQMKSVEGSSSVAQAKSFLGVDENPHAISESLGAEIALLKQEQLALQENSEEWQAYVDKIKELEELKTEVVKKENELAKEENLKGASNIVSQINTMMNQAASTINSVFDNLTKSIETNLDYQTALLDEQLANNLISQEEYQKKLAQIEKQAAEETYKVELAKWGISMAQAVVNTAAAVTVALASSPPPASYVMAGLSAAAGAAEIATIAMNKPTKPAFANGGIVGGNSYSGDRILARVNSGEMILNANQQRQLWDLATGKASYGNGSSVNVYNSAANLVDASATINEGVINVKIDSRVSQQLRNGAYNRDLTRANQIRTGTVYSS